MKFLERLRFKKNKKEVFPFKETPQTACITCSHILEEDKPILHITHDDDGYWQFLCVRDHESDSARLVALGEVYKLDNTIGKVSNLGFNMSANRSAKDNEWVIDG